MPHRHSRHRKTGRQALLGRSNPQYDEDTMWRHNSYARCCLLAAHAATACSRGEAVATVRAAAACSSVRYPKTRRPQQEWATTSCASAAGGTPRTLCLCCNPCCRSTLNSAFTAVRDLASFRQSNKQERECWVAGRECQPLKVPTARIQQIYWQVVSSFV